jgi:hypothetical protein
MANATTRKKQKLKLKLWEKQKGFCHLCGMLMRPVGSSRKHKGFPTFDHLIPVKDGGTNLQSNLLLAHKRCNNLRGHKPLPFVCPPLDCCKGLPELDTVGKPQLPSLPPIPNTPANQYRIYLRHLQEGRTEQYNIERTLRARAVTQFVLRKVTVNGVETIQWVNAALDKGT